MRQIDRVGNNIKPDNRIRQIDRVGNNTKSSRNVEIPINENDLPLLREIEAREFEARELMYNGSDQEEEAIKILEENISHGLYCNSYELLGRLYKQKKEYDKAIDVFKKGAKFFEEEKLEVPRRLSLPLEHTEHRRNMDIFMKNNEKGRKLEKEGDIDGAIKAYRKNADLRINIPHTYERLYILYRKKKDYESEIEIINLAIEVFSENRYNSSAIDKLKKRLEKVQKLYEKDKNQTKLI